MNKEYQIHTNFNLDEIEQVTEFHDHVTREVSQVSREIVKLKEDGIRKALKRLGWISPEALEQLEKNLKKQYRYFRIYNGSTSKLEKLEAQLAVLKELKK